MNNTTCTHCKPMCSGCVYSQLHHEDEPCNTCGAEYVNFKSRYNYCRDCGRKLKDCEEEPTFYKVLPFDELTLQEALQKYDHSTEKGGVQE